MWEPKSLAPAFLPDPWMAAQSSLRLKGLNSTHKGTELELRLSRTEAGPLVPRTSWQRQGQGQGTQGCPLGRPMPIPLMSLIPGTLTKSREVIWPKLWVNKFNYLADAGMEPDPRH